MRPFGRTAGSILSGISQCVSYAGGARVSFRQAQLNNVVDRHRAASDGHHMVWPMHGDGSIIPKIPMHRKMSLLLTVARRKREYPVRYQAEVKRAVAVTRAVKSAARRFGMSPDKCAGYEITQALIELERGIDISDADVIEKDPDQVRKDGIMEEAALLSGEETHMKAKKLSEWASDTVATWKREREREVFFFLKWLLGSRVARNLLCCLTMIRRRLLNWAPEPGGAKPYERPPPFHFHGHNVATSR